MQPLTAGASLSVYVSSRTVTIRWVLLTAAARGAAGHCRRYCLLGRVLDVYSKEIAQSSHGIDYNFVIVVVHHDSHCRTGNK